jgi:hypothetical protein
VAKYMGDGVLVYFGYPQAHEDDTERAVRAGLELVAAGSPGPFSAALHGKRHQGGVRRPRDHCHSGKCQPRSHPRAAGFGGRRDSQVGEDAKALTVQRGQRRGLIRAI